MKQIWAQAAYVYVSLPIKMQSFFLTCAGYIDSFFINVWKKNINSQYKMCVNTSLAPVSFLCIFKLINTPSLSVSI